MPAGSGVRERMGMKRGYDFRGSARVSAESRAREAAAAPTQVAADAASVGSDDENLCTDVREPQPRGTFDARAIRDLLKAAQADPKTLRRTIRRTELRQIVPLADSTIYEMERRGEFPQRFFLTPRCVVWDLTEVMAWLESRRQPGGNVVKKAPMPDVRKRMRGRSA